MPNEKKVCFETMGKALFEIAPLVEKGGTPRIQQLMDEMLLEVGKEFARRLKAEGRDDIVLRLAQDMRKLEASKLKGAVKK